MPLPSPRARRRRPPARSPPAIPPSARGRRRPSSAGTEPRERLSFEPRHHPVREIDRRLLRLPVFRFNRHRSLHSSPSSARIRVPAPERGAASRSPPNNPYHRGGDLRHRKAVSTRRGRRPSAGRPGAAPPRARGGEPAPSAPAPSPASASRGGRRSPRPRAGRSGITRLFRASSAIRVAIVSSHVEGFAAASRSNAGNARNARRNTSCARSSTCAPRPSIRERRC